MCQYVPIIATFGYKYLHARSKIVLDLNLILDLDGLCCEKAMYSSQMQITSFPFHVKNSYHLTSTVRKKKKRSPLLN